MQTTKRILRNSKLPYYRQLYLELHDKIVSGVWEPGRLLPSDSELVEKYAVSRVTARQALEALVNEGLIYRQRGRGTFVAHPTVEQGLSRIINFSQDMLQRGVAPGTCLLYSGLIPAPADIAEKLGIPTGAELARIDRLRMADNEPMSVEEAFFVHGYCPGLLQYDFVTNSLREQLHTRYGITWLRAKQSIQAMAASPEKAALLMVRTGAPLVVIERVSYSQRETPMEYLRIFHRGDRYVLYNDLKG